MIMTKTKSWIGGLLLTSSTALAGCATAPPPQELVDARAAYSRAEASPAKTLDPAGLHDASVALQHAEAAYKDDDEAMETRDMAYLAERKAQYTEANASTMSWKQREQEANQKADAARTSREQAQMQQKQGQLTQAQGQLSQTQNELNKTKEQLAQSEAQQREAMARLTAANTAQVKEEPRGTVITLSGAVLFESGKSMLLPTAQSKLTEVASVLKEQPDKNLLIEGHTDSRGSDETNQKLSKARAESVAQYLISQGVPAQRVTTAGLASNQPIADNETAEGRANNRRVEIVVQNGEPK